MALKTFQFMAENAGPWYDRLPDEEKGKIRVLVSIFDRETPVELDFLQVKKL